MRKTIGMLLLCLVPSLLLAADTLFVKETQIPILIDRQDNPLFYFRLNAQESSRLERVIIRLGKEVKTSEIQSIKFYYGGTEGLQVKGKHLFYPTDYLAVHIPDRNLAANPSYSILKAKVKAKAGEVALAVDQDLFKGVNYFWVSVQMKRKTSLLSTIGATIESVIVDGKPITIERVSPQGIVHRMGVGVRHAGDQGVTAYRIPGLVTTNKGTLLGVYDVRYNNKVDLQEHIDVGLSRSTDGGKTWEKMRLPISFGEYGGLPKAQNGVGDPSILVDKQTNTIWIAAAWTHGMGNKMAWFGSHPGMEIGRTAQLVLSKSTDDGRTWSAPINITPQVKDPSWWFLLQGPGRGITMDNGTLVFPVQFIDSTRMPHAAVMYSEDRGERWQMHAPARSNTTEAQVVEIEPGMLMLNMRDNRKGSRAVCVTPDMGRTWSDHPSSRSALPESVCMASLHRVKAEENALNRDLLIFSNPNTTKGRHSITIKISLDNGLTWLPDHQLLLDEADSWGYSCLTMIDRETIGILYESSVAQMTFQAIPLKEVVRSN